MRRDRARTREHRRQGCAEPRAPTARARRCRSNGGGTASARGKQLLRTIEDAGISHSSVCAGARMRGRPPYPDRLDGRCRHLLGRFLRAPASCCGVSRCSTRRPKSAATTAPKVTPVRSTAIPYERHRTAQVVSCAWRCSARGPCGTKASSAAASGWRHSSRSCASAARTSELQAPVPLVCRLLLVKQKSTRLNSSHPSISYAVFCLKKKKNNSAE